MQDLEAKAAEEQRLQALADDVAAVAQRQKEDLTACAATLQKVRSAPLLQT